jgi:hypothetical protein
LLQCMSPPLARNGHPDWSRSYPLSGAQLPRRLIAVEAEIDPNRTSQTIFLSVRSYFVIIGRWGALGVGAAGESANVTHAFQPDGRSTPSNSA